ncbi:MAG: N-acetylneuraminate synthase family protein, partial [FCB group bacterium]|nr:N-acetylneuraminate synthase family protein [FCB group bacterium]
MKAINIYSKKAGPGQPVFVIAEAGINHNGDLELAKKMVRIADETGVDAVKFQTFQASTIMTKNSGSAAHLEAGAGKEDVYSFVDRIALSADAHRELFELCNELGLVFLSTPLSFRDADLLEEIGVEAFKIASMDLNNLPFLEYVARKGKPMILSTGMGTLGEMESALNTIYSAGNDQVAVLHCTSMYPPGPEDVNLAVINTLRTAFDVPIGYSDHTSGNVVPAAAAVLGACIVEKHFTLDKTMPGPDQAVSGDPDDFKKLVSDIRIIEKALGKPVKGPPEGELGMRPNFRRSIVSEIDIPAGTIITEEMLTFKRPGQGIAPCD